MAWIVQWEEETGSTNADLLAAARLGAAPGTVLVADHQTAGRGRLGRRWEAPPGSSLLASLLFHSASSEGLHRHTQAVALAAAEACRNVARVDAVLKWPNDLLVGSRKVAGVLAETAPLPSGALAVVVGIGLNVSWPAPLPPDLAPTMTALNIEAGRDVDRAEVLRAMLDALDSLDWAQLHSRYRAELDTLGRTVRVERVGEVLEGAAVDVKVDGTLVVRTRSGDREVTTGDVVHLR
ncbi:MAG TPA: biotin--[acetyl-CoA-carboxylase] ligase [Acidimicrobiales bacterium]|nr:biotin--[acetyl-CoA-carboxylase] ligase [Acidimicrobiales bacterium]